MDGCIDYLFALMSSAMVQTDVLNHMFQVLGWTGIHSFLLTHPATSVCLGDFLYRNYLQFSVGWYREMEPMQILTM